MQNYLLMRLNAPMQSWGVSSRFSIRDTAKEPSKSGVIGLLCAALGISRDDANPNNSTFKRLSELKMGVRVLSEGVMQKDYHTAQEVARADKGTKPTELSTRWYLADADFLVALESEDADFLNKLQNALKNPKWQLFFGRKAFVPALPVYFNDGTFSSDLECAKFLESEEVERVLQAHQLTESKLKRSEKKEQRIIIEIDKNEVLTNRLVETVQDVPLDFGKRRFSLRQVNTTFFTPNNLSEGGNEDEENLSDKDDT